jgi:hypothetical protein
MTEQTDHITQHAALPVTEAISKEDADASARSVAETVEGQDDASGYFAFGQTLRGFGGNPTVVVHCPVPPLPGITPRGLTDSAARGMAGSS